MPTLINKVSYKRPRIGLLSSRKNTTPEGTFVRRFFEVRKPRVAAGPVGDHARNVVSVNETVM